MGFSKTESVSLHLSHPKNYCICKLHVLRSITIISPLRLYITITNTITPCTLYFKCTTQYYTLVLSYKFKYDSHITMITVQCTCTCGTIVHVLFRSTSF